MFINLDTSVNMLLKSSFLSSSLIVKGGVYPTFGAQITDKKLLGQFQETQSSQPAVFKGASSRTFGRPQKDEASVPR